MICSATEIDGGISCGKLFYKKGREQRSRKQGMLEWLSAVGRFVFVVSIGLAGVFLFVLVFKKGKFQITAAGIFIATLILAAGTGVLLGGMLDTNQGAEHVYSTCFGSLFSIPAMLFGGRKIWEQAVNGNDGRQEHKD